MVVPERVKDYFLKKAKLGIVLSAKELLKYCKKNGLKCNEPELKSLRREWKFLAIFNKPKKVSAYMGQALPRYGILQVDLGFIKPRTDKSRRRVRRRPWEDKPQAKGKTKEGGL
jgi:hypothetical protein